jgi:Mg2+/Co2+ transporter CorC
MDVQKSSKDTIKVQEIMIPKDKLIVMKADASADEALKRIFRENKSRIFVYEDSDRIPARTKRTRKTNAKINWINQQT